MKSKVYANRSYRSLFLSLFIGLIVLSGINVMAQSSLDKPFYRPMYVVHITETSTYNGPVKKDVYILYHEAPKNGVLITPDGSGGTFNNRATLVAGPFNTTRQVCSGAAGSAPASFLTGLGCPSVGGGTTGGGGSTTGVMEYPNYDAFVSRVRQIDMYIYEQWKERERARYSYEHGGASQSEAQRFYNAQRAIEQLQYQRISAVHEYRKLYQQALAYNFRSNPANESNRAQWQRAIDLNKQYYAQEFRLYQTLYGLKQRKFIGFNSPLTTEGILQWLNNPN